MAWYDPILRWTKLHPGAPIHGVPNLTRVASGLWRMGQPETVRAWIDLFDRLGVDPRKAVVVKLNTDTEGDDDWPSRLLGFTLIKRPLARWTLRTRPDPAHVRNAVDHVEHARRAGHVLVVVHGTTGRDRTGLVVALTGMRLFGWTRDYARCDMVEHGFRWGLAALDVALCDA